jgi:ornithine carbamoyltransferase
MGKEEEAEHRAAQFARYQINDEVIAAASPKAHVLHCLPAYRGKEITADVFEAHADAIFQQAENRLHAQKAVLTLLKS